MCRRAEGFNFIFKFLIEIYCISAILTQKVAFLSNILFKHYGHRKAWIRIRTGPKWWLQIRAETNTDPEPVLRIRIFNTRIRIQIRIRIQHFFQYMDPDPDPGFLMTQKQF